MRHFVGLVERLGFGRKPNDFTVLVPGHVQWSDPHRISSDDDVIVGHKHESKITIEFAKTLVQIRHLVLQEQVMHDFAIRFPIRDNVMYLFQHAMIVNLAVAHRPRVLYAKWLSTLVRSIVDGQSIKHHRVTPNMNFVMIVRSTMRQFS